MSSEIQMSKQSQQQSESANAKPVIQCPNFEEPLKPELMDAEMDIDLKTSKSLTGKQYILAIPITQFFRNVRNMYALINILNGQSIISLRLIEYFVVNYVLENNTFFDINRYNKHPEFLINNLRGKCKPIQDADQPIVMDKHTAINDLSQNITAQQQAYKNARAEIVADIKAKAAAATGRSASTNSKKNNISIDTFFNMKQIANHSAQYNLKPTEKNFDNYIIIHDNYKCQLKEYNKKNFDPFCRWNRIRLYYDKNKFFYTTIAQLNFFKWAIEKHILDYVIENLETIEKSMNEYEKNVKAEKLQRKAKQDVSTSKEGENTNIDTVSATTTTNSPDQALEQNAGSSIHTSSNSELLPISLLSTRKTKKRKIILANPEAKSKVKERKKKEFTKTNRSILFFSAYKVVSFD